MIVRLRDGTIIMGKPLTEDFPIDTPYGNLKVPLKALRSATSVSVKLFVGKALTADKSVT